MKQVSVSSPVLSTGAVAELIGASPRFVRQCCESGKIKATKIGKLWFVNRAALMQQLGITDEPAEEEVNA